MRYLTILPLLSGLLVVAAAPAAAVQQTPADASTSAAATPAAPAANPYQTSVPVADTSSKNRSHAFAVALERVMSRVTGHAPSSTARGEASTYVRQYRYERAPAGSPQPYRLVVTFAPSAIAHLQRSQDAFVAADGAEHADAAFGGLPAGDNAVWVSGVRTALDFAAVVSVLRTQPGVESVAVRKAHGDGMLLDVRTSVPLGRVLGALAARGHLASAGTAHAGAAASLRWRQ
ncbi:MAG TPA: DUF2066 domain-containing protein [Oleiagrimonas sp.]|nr:DUF2066 domain-containing protein [Oleiagrimonas sp.]